MRRIFLAGAGALALSGCVVGPNYVSPAPNAPAQTPFASAASPAFTGDEPDGQWWQLFRDPTLDALVREALTANTDLRVAEANLRRARAVLSESRAGRLPTTNISGSATYARQSGEALGLPGTSPTGDAYDVGLDVSYQLDLFGRIHRTIEASRADAEAVQAAFDLTRITVAAETTRAYADACSAGRQLAVAQESVRVQQETYDLTRRLLEGGRATMLESSQAGAQLDRTRATIPTLEAQRQTALYRLAVLTGRPPADFPREAATCAAPPALARTIPVGNGASLLARRPDIRQADRQLHAATARIGVATADLYPRITFGASLGSTGPNIGDIFTGGPLRWLLGPLLNWAFPNQEPARARIAAAKADTQASLAQFDGTVLLALQETETALTNYAKALDRRAALQASEQEAQKAENITRAQQREGRISSLDLIDAERTLAEARAQLADQDAAVSAAQIDLFRALGGGWGSARGSEVSIAR